MCIKAVLNKVTLKQTYLFYLLLSVVEEFFHPFFSLSSVCYTNVTHDS